MHRPLNARLAVLLAGAALLLPTAAACAGEQEAPAGEQEAPAGEQAPPVGGQATPTAAQEAPAGEQGGDSGQAPLNIVGLTDNNQLVEFSSDNPTPRETGTISGLGDGDTKLIGIDYRAKDGKLYGVGDKGGIYTVETSGQATSVGKLTIAPEGTNFGIDFNPAADALRVVSDTGQNLRQPMATTPLPATVADSQLSYPPAPGTAQQTPGVTGAAYTNNDNDPNTATTLYDLDSTTDQIALQSPANSGQLAPTGKLTVDAGSSGGFDIYSTTSGGSITGQRAFATLPVGGQYGLYRITLFSGKAEQVSGLDRNVVDIAIPLNQ
ncbi:MAG: DUF4394 domain-containing protein [Actinomycetota bacterium]|nr:DUF4394 domain-containing protein [Actinomycetota bacterium]